MGNKHAHRDGDHGSSTKIDRDREIQEAKREEREARLYTWNMKGPAFRKTLEILAKRSS